MGLHTVGPNNAVIISGGSTSTKKKITNSSWAFSAPGLSHARRLSLNLMTLKPTCMDVETVEGVPVNVSGVAQCKIINDPQFILIAAEQFLGRRPDQIQWSILQTLEGHLRAILGTLTVEELYKDRQKFASLVCEVASPDVAKMGIQIVSFVIKDISDDVNYLNSLGKRRTAEVKRDAAIGVAFANRDAGIREAECEKEAEQVKYECLSKIENYSRLYNLQKASFDKEVNAAKAEAALAYELAEAKLRQEIRLEEIGIKIVERRKNIEIEEKEIERKERELTSLIKLPVEAEKYRLETIAEGQKCSIVENAIGESNKIKKIEEASANRAKNVGILEAMRMGLKANALQKYGDAAISHLVLQKMPEIAASISAPLEKTEEIVLLGGNADNIISNINRLAGQIPPAINAINNVDFVKFAKKMAE